MIAEAGFLFLIIALCFSLCLIGFPSLGIVFSNARWIRSADRYAFGQFFFVILSWLALTVCFITNDFSVQYVLNNSSRELPWFYKLCAVWGGHEGSMLLWVLVLSLWTVGVSVASKQLPTLFRVRVLIVLGFISAGLIIFLISVSNPFLRQFSIVETDGRDLNPLLQDPGFLFHPPMLYMGYVGFSVAFAMAIAALWLGRVEKLWARWCRPWTLAAWCCLTVGITLGSWWAYRELGWGGWWFWDPVENASFMPWLAGTALIHSLSINEHRSQFKAWTILLAIATFSLSLMGTFLVRSGVLTSVHAFAVDPQRGLYILAFLILVIGGSLVLFSLRAHTLQSRNKANIFSRESLLLLNNIILASAMLTVLMGTLYPLIIDILGLGKLSVGAPYFNTVFIPLMLPLFALMGLAMHVRWRKDSFKIVSLNLTWSAVLSFIAPFVLLFLYPSKLNLYAFLGMLMASWVSITSFVALTKKIRSQGRHISRAFIGMILAHFGVAVTLVGIVISSNYGEMKDVRVSVGEQLAFSGYVLKFKEQRALNGENYHGTEAVFSVSSLQYEKLIYPQKRIYNVGRMALTDSAIDANPFRDIYVALGEPLGANAWSVRLYYKPLVRWIWGGGFLMFIGGGLALLDRRYYKPSPKVLPIKGVSL